MPETNNEKTTMSVFLTLLSVIITAVIIGFGSVMFKLLGMLA